MIKGRRACLIGAVWLLAGAGRPRAGQRKTPYPWQDAWADRLGRDGQGRASAAASPSPLGRPAGGGRLLWPGLWGEPAPVQPAGG